MKISNSKKQLAKIISENGGWRDGARFAAQDSKKDSYPSRIGFYLNRPEVDGTMWVDGGNGMVGRAEGCINGAAAVPNWHQTILSRDEYFHLYPASDADGWIEWKGGECPCPDEYGIARRRDGVEIPFGKQKRREWGHGESLIPDFQIVAYRVIGPDRKESAKSSLITVECEPTIEQLAAEYRNRKDYAERKQQEADAAKAEAEAKLAKLAELAAAGKAVGLAVSVAAPEPEPVITDWRDLRVGDEIYTLSGGVVTVTGFDPDNKEWPVLAVAKSGGDWLVGKDGFTFIRRPAKEADNA